VIVAAPDSAALAAARQVNSVPLVVIMFTTDPVEAQVVKSFAKPGTNVTGLYGRQSEIVAKRLQLLKETLPDLSRVGALYDAPGAGRLAELAVGARALKIATVPIELTPPYDLVGAVEKARRAKLEALILLDSVPVYFKRKELAQLALKAKLPTIAQFHQFVEVGGFMSYGNDPQAVFARAAYFVDRILQGTKPTDLPVEQMINFKLAINLKTAKALGVMVPTSILARADAVIQ
jgi:putative tryptophan/tyrosine transport system substrate-binding protein